MKTVWTGSVSFGLVNIPVRMYSASEPKDTGFRLLHKADNTPIENRRWCPKHGREVPWAEVVKGFEVGKDAYFPIAHDEIKALKPEKSDTIDITQIVPSNLLDPLYFESHYYLGPDSEKEKAYFLLKEVLEASGTSAIGTFVMREREYVCAITPRGKGMGLATLRYAHEVRDIARVDFLDGKPNLSAQELELAQLLLSKLHRDRFDISEFKDTFRDELKRLVEKKMKGHAIETPKAKAPKRQKNLVEALKASL
jgi:DNA end-binding protein Ku